MQSSFGATQCVFAEQYPYEISNVPLKDTPCPLEEYSVHLKQDFPWKGPQGEWGPGRAARARQKSLNLETLLARARGAPRTPFTPRTSFKGKCVNFHMSNLPFKGAVSLLEKPILLHNMQYFWHRASLSKVQYVLKCEILSECFFAPYNRALSFMATQSSFEKAAFVETWIAFHWYMYLIYSNLIQFNPIQSNPDISHLYNPIQSNQTQTNPIQSSPIQSNLSDLAKSNLIQSYPIQSNPIQSNPIYLI